MNHYNQVCMFFTNRNILVLWIRGLTFRFVKVLLSLIASVNHALFNW